MMNTAQLIHQQIDTLPQDAHLALLEYIDFLLHKYQKQPNDLSDSDALVQELIMKRYEQYSTDKQQNSESLQVFKKRLKQKYSWNE